MHTNEYFLFQVSVVCVWVMQQWQVAGEYRGGRMGAGRVQGSQACTVPALRGARVPREV